MRRFGGRASKKNNIKGQGVYEGELLLSLKKRSVRNFTDLKFLYNYNLCLKSSPFNSSIYVLF